LSLGVQGVEGERGLAGAGQSRNHDEPVPGEVDVDVLQIVGARSADANLLHMNLLSRFPVAAYRDCGSRGPTGECKAWAGSWLAARLKTAHSRSLLRFARGSRGTTMRGSSRHIVFSRIHPWRVESTRSS